MFLLEQMQATKYSTMEDMFQICENNSVDVRKYASMRECLQVCKYVSIQLYMYASMQVYNYASIKLCKYASTDKKKITYCWWVLNLVRMREIWVEYLWYKEAKLKLCWTTFKPVVYICIQGCGIFLLSRNQVFEPIICLK